MGVTKKTNKIMEVIFILAEYGFDAICFFLLTEMELVQLADITMTT